jgi:hypothetical protein
MKKYNRALDYTVLALAELQAGKPVLAARLLASAVKEPDIGDAIAILEASNRHAHKTTVAAAAAAVKKPAAQPTVALASKKRLTASDEFPFKGGEEVEAETDDLDGTDFDSDPLDEVSDFDGDDEDGEVMPEVDEVVEEEPAVAMAKVLSGMTRSVKK